VLDLLAEVVGNLLWFWNPSPRTVRRLAGFFAFVCAALTLFALFALFRFLLVT
jgi:hypothetical protein